MHPLSLLIKPVSATCNMNCDYCFYHDVSSCRETALHTIMPDTVLEQLIKKACSFATGSCTFAFQGGEPTLAGLDFFRKAVQLVHTYAPRNLQVHFALQTNGYLVSRELLELFKKNNFLLGISLDGTEEIHNLHRKNHYGQGTFSSVQKTLSAIRQLHIDYNILSVVTDTSAERIQEIYTFFKKQKFDFLQFIPCLPPLPKKGTNISAPFPLSPEAYGEFLVKLFDLWYSDFFSGSPLSIRQFDNYLLMLLGRPPEACDMGGRCSVQYVIESDGSVYPCDFFCLDEYTLGNVCRDDFETFDKNRDRLGFIEESMQQIPRCKTCPYFVLCRGGCKRHRLMAAGSAQDFTQNYFCQSFYRFFEECGDKLLNVASAIQKKRKNL